MRDWHFSYLIFSRFIIFTCRNYFTLCKIVLCIWRKKFFSTIMILWKKPLGRLVARIRAGGGCVRVGGGKLGQGVGALKRGSWNPLTNYKKLSWKMKTVLYWIQEAMPGRIDCSQYCKSKITNVGYWEIEIT